MYAYYVDETSDEMAAGNAAMALVYSGEAATAIELNDDLSYTVQLSSVSCGGKMVVSLRVSSSSASITARFGVA